MGRIIQAHLASILIPFPLLSYLTILSCGGLSFGSILDAAKNAPMKKIDWKARSHDDDSVRMLYKRDCAELR